MADLSYNDVQRAVQDGMRNLQNDVQRLGTNVERITRETDQGDETARYVLELRQTMNNVQAQLDNMTRNAGTSGMANVEQRIAGLQTDVQDVKARLVNMEKYLTQVSQFITAREERTREDDQYK